MVSEFWAHFLAVMLPLLVAIDPLGLIPVYLGMTAGLAPQHRLRVSLEAMGTGLVVCVGFMFLGQAVFRFLAISEADFRIAGGIILLVLAVLDLLIEGKPTVHTDKIDGIVPLGMPLIAGPAAMTTVLVLAGNPQLGYTWTLVGILCTFAMLGVALMLAARIASFAGISALRAFSKLVMVLLAAIAVNFIRTGIAEIISGTRSSAYP